MCAKRISTSSLESSLGKLCDSAFLPELQPKLSLILPETESSAPVPPPSPFPITPSSPSPANRSRSGTIRKISVSLKIIAAPFKSTKADAVSPSPTRSIFSKFLTPPSTPTLHHTSKDSSASSQSDSSTLASPKEVKPRKSFSMFSKSKPTHKSIQFPSYKKEERNHEEPETTVQKIHELLVKEGIATKHERLRVSSLGTLLLPASEANALKEARTARQCARTLTMDFTAGMPSHPMPSRPTPWSQERRRYRKSLSSSPTTPPPSIPLPPTPVPRVRQISGPREPRGLSPYFGRSPHSPSPLRSTADYDGEYDPYPRSAPAHMLSFPVSSYAGSGASSSSTRTFAEHNAAADVSSVPFPRASLDTSDLASMSMSSAPARSSGYEPEVDEELEPRSFFED